MWSALRMLGAGSLVADKKFNSNKAITFQDRGKLYGNLNLLKQGFHQSETVFGGSSLINGIQKKHQSYGFEDYPIAQKPLWPKSKVGVFSGFNNCGVMKAYVEEEKSLEKPLEKKSNSTLSLLIEAYEKAVENESSDKLNPSQTQKDKNDLKKTWKNAKDFFISQKTFENPWEIPRQQSNNEPQIPEVAKYQAGQKLLNPNASVPAPRRNRERKPSQSEPVKKKGKKEESNERLNELKNALLLPPKRENIQSPINQLQDENLLPSIVQNVSTSSNKLQVTNENSASPEKNKAKTFPYIKDQKTITVLRQGMNVNDEKIKAFEEENIALKEALQKSRDGVHNLKRQLERTKNSTDAKNEELKSQIEALKDEMGKQEADFNVELEKWKNLCAANQDLIGTMKDEIVEFKNQLQEYAAKQGIAVLFEGNKYTSKTLHGMAQLKNLGVADKKMGPVIKAVLGMVDLAPNRVPSAATARRSWSYLAALNQAQIREMLLQAAKRSVSATLGSDETTKNGKKLEAFVYYTTDEANNAREYCIGMVEMLDKSAATAVEKLKQIIKKIESDEGAKSWETFIMTVDNVISDQANTQKLFNRLIENIRKVIVENDERYDSMTAEEKEDLYKLRKFYCQLHILSNATPIVTNALLQHERKCRDNDNIAESAAVRIIKEVARLTGQRASSKYDVHKKWMLYVKNKKIMHANIPDFKGHRWMILFSIGGSVYYLKDDLIDFDKEFKTELRKLELKKWMDDPVTSSHLLVIAAVNEFITTPFWRLTEHDPSISSITTHAQALINFLERVIDDPMLLLTGEPPLEEYEEDFEITHRSKAHVRKLDNTVPQHPLIVKEAIENVAASLLEYFKKQFKDFLPNGEHYESNEKTDTVPRSNRRCESIFGLATWGFQRAPNQRTVVREALIQATVNDVFEWFNKKTPEEKEQLFEEAAAAAPKIANDAVAEAKALEDEAWKRLLSQKEADDKAEKVQTRKEREALDKVQQHGGPWKSVTSMDAALLTLGSEVEKKKAIVDNLRYHKVFLKDVAPSSKLLTITANGKPKELKVLEGNLKFLITNAFESDIEENAEDDIDF